MQKSYLVAFILAATVCAIPAGAGSRPKFLMMKTWGSGHSTALDTPTNRVEVGDEMDPNDQPLCDEFLAALNRSVVPTRHFDVLNQPVLPSALTPHLWTAMGIPHVSAVAAAKDRPLKTLLETLAECDRTPRFKGYIPISCSYDQTEIKFGQNDQIHLIRMIMHPKKGRMFDSPVVYFTTDSKGRIVDQFFPQLGESFGAGTVFRFKGTDYFGTWSRARNDFSTGYQGRRFKPAKTTFEIAKFERVDGPTALRSCVFGLR